MIIKKKFKLVEDKVEESFLNDQSNNGFNLETYDGVNYHFKKSGRKEFYLVEFFFNKLDKEELSYYAKKNYRLVCIYESTKAGYYYFFASNNPVNDYDRNLKDKHQQLLNSKQRVDRFSAVVFVASFSLFTYWYFTTLNELYIFILLLIVLLTGYYGHIYLQTIKKLSEYTSIITKREGDLIGDNEGCSK